MPCLIEHNRWRCLLRAFPFSNLGAGAGVGVDLIVPVGVGVGLAVAVVNRTSENVAAPGLGRPSDSYPGLSAAREAPPTTMVCRLNTSCLVSYGRESPGPRSHGYSRNRNYHDVGLWP